MDLTRFAQAFFAAAFGLGFLAFGITSFLRMDASERRVAAKLESIQSGAVQPEMLWVVRKYVNPGRSGLAHIVFSSARQGNVDIVATTSFFNRLNAGDSIRGYQFPDGYFVPENQWGRTRGGKWFLLGLGALMGSACLALARAVYRLPGR